MFTQAEFIEDKRGLSQKLEEEVDQFLKKGGKITEVTTGVKAHPNLITGNTDDSGHPGITWKKEYGQWSVRTTNSKVHLGYAKTLCEALAMQQKHQAQQTWKEEGK